MAIKKSQEKVNYQNRIQINRGQGFSDAIRAEQLAQQQWAKTTDNVSTTLMTIAQKYDMNQAEANAEKLNFETISTEMTDDEGNVSLQKQYKPLEDNKYFFQASQKAYDTLAHAKLEKQIKTEIDKIAHQKHLDAKTNNGTTENFYNDMMPIIEHMTSELPDKFNSYMMPEIDNIITGYTKAIDVHQTNKAIKRTEIDTANFIEDSLGNMKELIDANLIENAILEKDKFLNIIESNPSMQNTDAMMEVADLVQDIENQITFTKNYGAYLSVDNVASASLGQINVLTKNLTEMKRVFNNTQTRATLQDSQGKKISITKQELLKDLAGQSSSSLADIRTLINKKLADIDGIVDNVSGGGALLDLFNRKKTDKNAIYPTNYSKINKKILTDPNLQEIVAREGANMGIPFDPAAVELPSTLIGYAATLPYPPSEVVKIAETQIERNDPNYIRGVVSGLGLLENFKRTVTNNKTGDQQTLIQSRIPMLGLSDATENKLVYLSNLYAMQDGVLYDEQITSYKTNAKKRLEELIREDKNTNEDYRQKVYEGINSAFDSFKIFGFGFGSDRAMSVKVHNIIQETVMQRLLGGGTIENLDLTKAKGMAESVTKEIMTKENIGLTEWTTPATTYDLLNQKRDTSEILMPNRLEVDVGLPNEDGEISPIYLSKPLLDFLQNSQSPEFINPNTQELLQKWKFGKIGDSDTTLFLEPVQSSSEYGYLPDEHVYKIKYRNPDEDAFMSDNTYFTDRLTGSPLIFNAQVHYDKLNQLRKEYDFSTVTEKARLKRRSAELESTTGKGISAREQKKILKKRQDENQYVKQYKLQSK
tara:strand:- start:3701 stop:6157 length:2457 start_codon:yes stop_codon:yes gene_type:complete